MGNSIRIERINETINNLQKLHNNGLLPNILGVNSKHELDKSITFLREYRNILMENNDEIENKHPAYKVNISNEEIATQYEKGMSIYRIAKNMGVTDRTIKNRLKEVGYTIKKMIR